MAIIHGSDKKGVNEYGLRLLSLQGHRHIYKYNEPACGDDRRQEPNTCGTWFNEHSSSRNQGIKEFPHQETLRTRTDSWTFLRIRQCLIDLIISHWTILFTLRTKSSLIQHTTFFIVWIFSCVRLNNFDRLLFQHKLKSLWYSHKLLQEYTGATNGNKKHSFLWKLGPKLQRRLKSACKCKCKCCHVSRTSWV